MQTDPDSNAFSKTLNLFPNSRDRYDTNTYRAVYTVKLGDNIFVLHAFQKKSTRGIRTPKKEIDLIKQRLKMAQEMEAKNE